MQIFKAELKSRMLGEFAPLKSKHDGGVAEANQQNLLNVIANKVKQSLKATQNLIANEMKQSFLHCHCEPKARQTFQLHNNRLPRRYAPRNDDVAVSNGLPRRYAPRNDDVVASNRLPRRYAPRNDDGVASNRLPRRYAPRNDDVAVSKGLPRRYVHRNDDVVASNRLPRRCAPRNDCNVCGRSMIEMLGVLAIIGVLSVGGIAGYSKAMTKVKINKTIEQITQISTGILTAFVNSKTVSGSNNDNSTEFSTNVEKDMDLLKTLGVIDANMIVNGELIHGFGGYLWIYGQDRHFSIVLTGLSREACIALATNDFGVGSNYFKGIEVTSGQPVVPEDCIYDIDNNFDSSSVNPGDAMACTHSSAVSIPLSPADAAQGCACASNTCSLGIAYQY